MTALAHGDAFLAFVSEHKDDALGSAFAQIFDLLKRSAQTVHTFSAKPEVVETYLSSPYHHARNGNQLLTFVFDDGTTAVARVVPVGDNALIDTIEIKPGGK